MAAAPQPNTIFLDADFRFDLLIIGPGRGVAGSSLLSENASPRSSAAKPNWLRLPFSVSPALPYEHRKSQHKLRTRAFEDRKEAELLARDVSVVGTTLAAGPNETAHAPGGRPDFSATAVQSSPSLPRKSMLEGGQPVPLPTGVPHTPGFARSRAQTEMLVDLPLHRGS